MYLEHFGLSRFPFSIAPDPEFLLLTQGHQEALAHLHYSLAGPGGLICLTGEVGTGKTTVCRAFMDSAPDNVRFAYIFNPQLSAQELLQSICDELEVAYPTEASLKVLYQLLNTALLEMYAIGRKVICLIDEAQSMPAPLLEQVRLLTNLETNKEKLLTLILVGQPELNELLARHDLRQLNQRITARFHLDHLKENEVGKYLDFRLQQAGCETSVFSAKVAALLWRASRGVPRILNSLADRALLGSYAVGELQVPVRVAKRSIKEVMGGQIQRSEINNKQLWTVFKSLVAVIVLAALISQWRSLIDYFPEIKKAAITPVAQLTTPMGFNAENCQQVIQYNWQCLWVDWSLDELKQSGRSSVVRVREYVTGEKIWLPLTQLSVNDYAYIGEALLLWQPPVGYEKPVRPGQSSEIISWVRQHLGMAWGDDWQVISPSGQQPQINNSQYYDPLLANRVADFQAQHGLLSDKILGPKTILRLQNETLSEPQNRRLQEGS